MSGPVLIVVYNHHFTKNIDRIETIYKNRFSRIFHLMPFYRGDRANVIPVYANSRHFQGYIAQGLKAYFSEDAEHYLFVADDLVLNPRLDERNYESILAIDDQTSFAPGLVPLDCFAETWAHLPEAYQFRTDQVGLELTGLLPSAQEATERIAFHGAEVSVLSFKSAFPPPSDQLPLINRNFARIKWSAKRLLRGHRQFELAYPMVGGYSDFLAIDRSSIKEFCHLCGVFASCGLFVELAIPTALALSARKISTEGSIPMKGRALWNNADHQFLVPYDRKLDRLLAGFPDDCLYIHPIKLSQWT